MRVLGNLDVSGIGKPYGSFIRVAEEVSFPASEPPLGTGLLYINTVTGFGNVTGTPVGANVLYYSLAGSSVWNEAIPDVGTIAYIVNTGVVKYYDGSNWVDYSFTSNVNEVEVQDADFSGPSNAEVGYARTNNRLFVDNAGMWNKSTLRDRAQVNSGALPSDSHIATDTAGIINMPTSSTSHMTVGAAIDKVIDPAPTQINLETSLFNFIGGHSYIMNISYDGVPQQSGGWFTRPDMDQISDDIQAITPMPLLADVVTPTKASGTVSKFVTQLVGNQVLFWGYYASPAANIGTPGSGNYYVPITAPKAGIDNNAVQSYTFSGSSPNQIINGTPVGFGLASYIAGTNRFIGKVVVFFSSLNRLYFGVTNSFASSGTTSHALFGLNLMNDSWYSTESVGLRFYFHGRITVTPIV